ncbi:DedA family protein [Enteractinococcus coprophilus]|uniref:Membrane protein DedA with SNARE-associated domain n=1 Tax=Enteractinococcus coprophilus TaxID=1027633 RepID=A0A543AFL4_9MICC|nr:VTT domain-containing protein [Enteractinococcus coprophilus]TQL71371.1 membrane protein DedA with SNARE-associated domain [Enteractinococcus coprophilus]
MSLAELGTSPWLILVVLVFCCVDAVFPIVPSDSFVTAATVMALASGASSGFIILLTAAAALGGFTGDCLAYYVGARVPVRRIPGLRSAKGQAAFHWVKRAFAHRGSTLLLTGRFIPVGRIVVNMTAGATSFPLSRFFPVAALAGVLWAGLATLMGMLAHHVLPDNTLLAVVVGVGLGIVFGLVIDWVLQRLPGRRPEQA